MTNPVIEFIPDQKTAYIRRTGAYGPENYMTMESLKKWAAEKGMLRDSAVIYAIVQDNPALTPPANCRYDVCITLNDDFEIDAEVNEGRFEQGWYAVFKIAHTVEAAQQAWQWILPRTQEAGCLIDEKRVVVERYRQELVDHNLCELCVPIVK